ncbi:hypothetical protein NSERUTF1_6702 [Nocardia seriolae]|nr:hypothetical protein NSERUTF1_6702 [Nocardia seriolae]
MAAPGARLPTDRILVISCATTDPTTNEIPRLRHRRPLDGRLLCRLLSDERIEREKYQHGHEETPMDLLDTDPDRNGHRTERGLWT